MTLELEHIALKAKVATLERQLAEAFRLNVPDLRTNSVRVELDMYQSLQDELAIAKARARTPGTVEVCEQCGRNAEYYVPICKNIPCRVKPAQSPEVKEAE